MATRSTIVVVIPEDKKGTTYKFDKGDLEFDTPEVTIPEDATHVEVYHHWDGYPEWLGNHLIDPKSGLGDFDTIMKKIVSGGDMSMIGQPYHAWRNEKWDDVKPTFTNHLSDVSEEYQYIFDTDNQWYVRQLNVTPELVTDVLERIAKEAEEEEEETA